MTSNNLINSSSLFFSSLFHFLSCSSLCLFNKLSCLCSLLFFSSMNFSHSFICSIYYFLFFIFHRFINCFKYLCLSLTSWKFVSKFTLFQNSLICCLLVCICYSSYYWWMSLTCCGNRDYSWDWTWFWSHSCFNNRGWFIYNNGSLNWSWNWNIFSYWNNSLLYLSYNSWVMMVMMMFYDWNGNRNWIDNYRGGNSMDIFFCFSNFITWLWSISDSKYIVDCIVDNWSRFGRYSLGVLLLVNNDSLWICQE